MWLRTSDASSLSADDVAAKLKVDKSVGLGWKEADLRRQLIGFNEFSFKEGDPPWKKYIEQVIFVAGTLAFLYHIMFVSRFTP